MPIKLIIPHKKAEMRKNTKRHLEQKLDTIKIKFEKKNMKVIILDIYLKKIPVMSKKSQIDQSQ